MKKSAYQCIPQDVINALTPAQQQALESSLQRYFTSNHAIDLRTTIPIPFVPKRAYMVLLAGIDRRSVSRGEFAIKLTTLILLVSVFILMCTLLGMIALYVLKSLLGIDIVQGFSLGIFK